MRFTKRIISVAVSVCSMVALLQVNNYNYMKTSAINYSDEMIYDNIVYKNVDIDDDNIYDYITITACSKNATSVIIPPKIDEIPVVSIDERAFFCCSTMGNIEIADSIINIGDYAFSGCSGLKNINIPSNLRSIGEQAFAGCNGLGDITLPDGIESIDDYAFYQCHSLTSINIPNSVSMIGNFAFFNCVNLTNITIPDSVAEIGGGIFCKCLSLKDVVISNNIKSLKSFGNANYKYGFFEGCEDLKTIIIPESVENIGEKTFDACDKLRSIAIKNPKCDISDIPNNVKIYGYTDSTAHVYAIKNGNEFDVIENYDPEITQISGDANDDGKINVRDCAFIASALAKGEVDSLPECADFNGDGKVNVRDAAAIASALAKGEI